MKKGMKKWKKLIIIGIVIIMGTGVCGCSMKRNDSNGKKLSEMSNKVAELVLNERQKEILEEVGLSTDVEELTYMQKRAIITIDEMLTAMEEKYDRSFSYAGYVAPGLLEYEHLIAYPSDGARSIDSFEVRKVEGENGTEYEDDYMNVVARKIYEEYIAEYCQTQVGENNVKVYSIITGIKDEGKVLKEEQIEFNVSGESNIFLDAEKVTEEAYNELRLNCKKWMEDHGINDSTEFILLKEGELKKVNAYNYTDYFASEYYLRDDEDLN